MGSTGDCIRHKASIWALQKGLRIGDRTFAGILLPHRFDHSKELSTSLRRHGLGFDGTGERGNCRPALPTWPKS